jgi:hypothetical protein
MNTQGVSLLVFTSLLLASATGCRAQASDDFEQKALASFENKLKSLPTDHDLGAVYRLCMRLPVRDKTPGQVGDGHPGDRDTKLKCMLQFLTVMDQLIEDNSPPATNHIGMIRATDEDWMSGKSPEWICYQTISDVKDPVLREKYAAEMQAMEKALTVANEHHNFQGVLREMRGKYARFEIPDFIKYDYPASEKNQHLRQIITDGLKSDPKAKDLMASLLKEAGAS